MAFRHLCHRIYSHWKFWRIRWMQVFKPVILKIIFSYCILHEIKNLFLTKETSWLFQLLSLNPLSPLLSAVTNRMVQYSKIKQTKTKWKQTNLRLCCGLITAWAVQVTAFLDRGHLIGQRRGLAKKTFPVCDTMIRNKNNFLSSLREKNIFKWEK